MRHDPNNTSERDAQVQLRKPTRELYILQMSTVHHGACMWAEAPEVSVVETEHQKLPNPQHRFSPNVFYWQISALMLACRQSSQGRLSPSAMFQYLET